MQEALCSKTLWRKTLVKGHTTPDFSPAHALAEELLRGNVKQGDTLDVRAAGERLSFKADQPEPGQPANGSPVKFRG
jgi:hypothetical protein